MQLRRTKFLQFLMILSTLSALSSCTFVRMVIYNKDDITDYRKFPSRSLHNDSIKFTFDTTANKRATIYLDTKKEGKITFDDFLEKYGTVAFLIIQNDTIMYENYFKGYEKASVVPSFSMAKSILSILTGCAIDEGLIKSVNEPVTNYLPELKDNGFDKVTIENLLQMTSGIKFNEGNLLALGKLYYTRNQWKIISKLKLETEPGSEFRYLSADAQLLGFVLEKALKGKSVTQYLQEKLWQPLGMEYDASWSIDRKKNGMEKTFCCLNACARDFAKIGRLYLNKGNWNGKQIVSEAWVARSLQIDTTNGSLSGYQYMWHLPTPDGDFMAAGKQGQVIYVNPSKNLIIVRLGRKSGDMNWWGFVVDLASHFQVDSKKEVKENQQGFQP